ncbi:hypothetical protein NO559_07915 [Dasania sp. GY-MA-18]|uniref:Uncharacterized protein n=1 Tax=Dasania phycosphaerae TaxID=2950436 RepID=A0A9J6RL51_9GAMM|nr:MULTISPECIES: hypothetical protein [Dasania]MCR8922692.1 hypothetical protein [Dasania sp. GY-MA-18]MCZ0865122.1 hypothetical protein [Dasania phycosphaerae]MCZ0868848.1 hypothetical protein [Dasania phycosphaerae]
MTDTNEQTHGQSGPKGEQQRVVMCEWKRLADELPPEPDKWYLFGGYDSNGDFVFDKYYFSAYGLVNGWKVEVAIGKGNIWWCLPNPPSDT